MREFFRGWRRKVGVVTLGLACVFAAGWVRSLYVMDTFSFSHPPKVFMLVSVDGTVGWQGFRKTDISSLFDGFRWHSQKTRSIDDIFNQPESLNKWHWNGFGAMQLDSGFTRLGCIPYWSIVLLLTAISLWLLLSKLRPPASKATEPLPTTGT